jgi:hypothetical protein
MAATLGFEKNFTTTPICSSVMPLSSFKVQSLVG